MIALEIQISIDLSPDIEIMPFRLTNFSDLFR